MLLHDVNKQLVDLRYSEFDESELDELKAQKTKLEAKIATAKTKKPDYEKELEKLEAEIKETEREIEEDRKAGRAKFKNKSYVTYGKNRRAPYHFTWVRYTPTNDFREFNSWITGYGYSPVKPGKDPFYPVGAKVNAANYWQFHDVVWVKRDLKEYLLEKVKERKAQIGGKELIDRLTRKIEIEQAYMVENQYNQISDMARQIEENGLEVDDSVLASLGI
jgi:DNA repair exonuclease SbcCD ATPase subunit